MAAPATELGGARGQAVAEPAALGHLTVSTAFLVLGGLLTALALVTVRFPAASTGVLTYGRLRPMAMTAVMVGWLSLSLVGGAYFVTPRLTGTRLWGERLALAALAAATALSLAGMLAIGFGLGDGVGPLGLPWWIDLPLAATLAVPALVVFQTVRRRVEEGVFVTQWFVMAGVAWLPLLLLVGGLPGLAAIGRSLQEVTLISGFATLWVTAVGTGLAYYVVVKDTGNPLANRQLARVGFWSLAFASIWAGPAQLGYGPVPGWLGAVAAALGLALPVAAIANASGIALTIDRGWEGISGRPATLAAAGGMALGLVAAFATAVGGFRTPGALVGLTPYWDGVTYLGLLGVGGLLAAAWTYHALPSLSGRRLTSPDLARRHVRWTVIGTAGTALLLMAAGLLQGFGWTGHAFAVEGFGAVGPGWSEAGRLAQVFTGLAAVTGLVTLAGQAAFVLVVQRTLTSGRAEVQEVLVEVTG